LNLLRGVRQSIRSRFPFVTIRARFSIAAAHYAKIARVIVRHPAGLKATWYIARL
jgi:hypothetical protein